jgi:hypothetical protein
MSAIFLAVHALFPRNPHVIEDSEPNLPKRVDSGYFIKPPE